MALQQSESDRGFRRVLLASFVGTVIEWYDFYLYATAAALVFDRVFFPEYDPFSGQIAAFGTFAVGFFARPVGGMVFGHYGDRIGRKAMLVLTFVLMGISTSLIGALPSYHDLGIAAPILLVLLRFVQGFAVGGEWGGAVLMVVEHGHNRARGFYGSLSQSGTSVGLLLAMGVFSAFSRLPEEQFLKWGWRVPFFLGIVLMFVGFIIRTGLEESPLFQTPPRQPQRRRRSWPLFEAIRLAPRSIVVILAARIAENSCSYVLTVFLLNYATEHLGLARGPVLKALLIASALGMLSIPVLGKLSDRLGRRNVYVAGALLMALSVFPTFRLLEATRALSAVYLVLIFGFSICVAAMFAPQAAFFSELFPTAVRYSGSSTSYQLAAALGGGLAPMIATKLLQLSDGKLWSIALYMISLCLLGASAVLFSRETARVNLNEVGGLEPQGTK